MISYNLIKFFISTFKRLSWETLLKFHKTTAMLSLSPTSHQTRVQPYVRLINRPMAIFSTLTSLTYVRQLMSKPIVYKSMTEDIIYFFSAGHTVIAFYYTRRYNISFMCTVNRLENTIYNSRLNQRQSCGTQNLCVATQC